MFNPFAIELVFIMKKLGLASALLLAMTGAQAYQVEVQGQSEFLDTTDNDKNFTGAAQGTYYFKNVDASKGPLAEAAFLNQASSVSAAYNYSKYNEADGFNTETHTYGAKAEAYVPTKFVPVYASASYNHTKLDAKNNFSAAFADEGNGDRYAVEVGAVVAPNFLVALGYTSVVDQYSLDAFNILSNGVVKAALESDTIARDQDAVTARTKYVGAIDGTNMAVGFETNLLFAEYKAYGLKTDLFVNPQLSVGASYAESSFNDTPSKAWGANVNYFITPAVAVGASYVNANAENNETNDTQTVGLNAKFRF